MEPEAPGEFRKKQDCMDLLHLYYYYYRCIMEDVSEHMYLNLNGF